MRRVRGQKQGAQYSRGVSTEHGGERGGGGGRGGELQWGGRAKGPGWDAGGPCLEYKSAFGCTDLNAFGLAPATWGRARPAASPFPRLPGPPVICKTHKPVPSCLPHGHAGPQQLPCIRIPCTSADSLPRPLLGLPDSSCTLLALAAPCKVPGK